MLHLIIYNVLVGRRHSPAAEGGSVEKIDRISRELAYEGSILKVYRDTVKLPRGGCAVWDFIGHVGAAAVVPVTDDGRIVLVKQYRNALDRFTLELPAGKKDSPDEPGRICAARELEEETGLRCSHLTPLLTIDTAVAFCNERIELFLAEGLLPGERHLDEEEDIETESFTPDELLGKIDAGEICDAKTVAGILAAERILTGRRQ